MNRPQPVSILGKLVTGIVGIVAVGLFSSLLITVGIWPGEAKLLAPILCTDAQPDPFVVTDTYSSPSGETAIDFSLYCMGPRGDSTDHGFLVPFLMISLVNGVVIMAVLSVLDWLNRGRRRARQRPEDLATTGESTDDDPPRTAPTGTSDAADPSGSISNHETLRGPNKPPTGSTSGPFVD